jgi:two-component system OmpR family response regulator
MVRRDLLPTTAPELPRRAYRRLPGRGTIGAMAHILLVDDEIRFARAVGEGLTDQGFQVRLAHDGFEGYRLGKEPQFDVIVLDIMLPGLSGVEACRRLRAEDVATPILMLTARDGDSDEAQALDSGADDYLRKPFSFQVLVARCRALLRRGGREGWSELVVGNLVLDPGRRVARRGDVEVHLSRRETALLEYLMRSGGEIRSKDEILDHVWGDVEDRGTNLVEVYVGYLRKKLDQPFGTNTLRTHRGHGYQLEGTS